MPCLFIRVKDFFFFEIETFKKHVISELPLIGGLTILWLKICHAKCLVLTQGCFFKLFLN